MKKTFILAFLLNIGIYFNSIAQTAITFNGNDVAGTAQRADMGSVQSFTNFTIEFDVKHGGASANAYDRIVSNFNNGFSIACSAAGNLRFYSADLALGWNTTTYTMPLNVWHHQAWVRSGTNLSLYINGAFTWSVTCGAGVLNAGQWLLAANQANYAENANVTMDNFRLWNTDRSAAQIAANYYVCLNGSEPNLVRLFNFEENTGTTLNDLATADGVQNATLINTTAWGAGKACSLSCSLIDQTVAPATQTVCSGSSATITTSSSENGVNYYLRDSSTNAIINGPVAGTGSGLNFMTGAITGSSAFNVFAEGPGSNNAIDLPTANDHARFSSPFYNYTNEITVESWVNYNGGALPWAGQSSASVDNMATNVWLWHSGTWYVNDNGTWRNVSMPALSTGWTHVATVANSTGLYVYYNGVLVSSNTSGITTSIRNNSVSIVDLGHDPRFAAGTGGRNSNVGYDNFRIWNTAKTATQIATNMTVCLTGSEANLVQLTKMNEGNGITLNSLTGSNATIMNPTSNWIAGTGSCGSCSYQMSTLANVTVGGASPTITVNSGTICSGESFTMTPSGAVTYTFSSGSAVVSPSVSTNYTVTGSDAAGCANSVGITSSVSVNASPSVVANTTSTLVCGSGTVTLTGSGAITYTWTSGVTDGVAFTPTVTDTYTVTGTAANSCTNMATVSVTVDAIPVITVNSGAICSGNSFTMMPSGAITYTFSSGSAVVSPTATTSYSVDGSSANGCMSTASAISSVTVNALPTVSAMSSTSLLCVGQTASLTASGASTYTWNTSSTNTVIAVSPTITTSYTVMGTDANGCDNNAVITQSVSACTGVNQLAINSNEIILYPNPFNSKITIQSNGSNQVVLVYNALGSIVHSVKLENEKTEIDLSNQSSGVYFVRIGTLSKKIIKE